MMLDAMDATELLEVMPDTVSVYKRLADDEWGNEQYATAPIELRANITFSSMRGTAATPQDQVGPEILVRASIIVLGNDVSVGDRIDFLGFTKYVNDLESFRDAPAPGWYCQQITVNEE